MKQTTLVFLIKEDKVVLAMKKRGFGVGKWNGVGGKVHEGEGVRAAAAREAKEEIGVTIAEQDLQPVAKLHFVFQGNPDWEQFCDVFITRAWQGEPTESEEMRPQWYAINQLPFADMWVDDPHWLPEVLAGDTVEADFLFDASGEKLLNLKMAVTPRASQPS